MKTNNLDKTTLAKSVKSDPEKFVVGNNEVIAKKRTDCFNCWQKYYKLKKFTG